MRTPFEDIHGKILEPGRALGEGEYICRVFSFGHSEHDHYAPITNIQRHNETITFTSVIKRHGTYDRAQLYWVDGYKVISHQGFNSVKVTGRDTLTINFIIKIKYE